MVPHATLRLKQGFGRLIRTRTDRGAVVLCDARVVAKRYGRAMLEALPPARRLVAPWAEIRQALRGFYAGEELPASYESAPDAEEPSWDAGGEWA